MHILRPPHKARRAPRSAGFTLAEVMVALVIFVFGALAIIRIFPPALGVIQNSESRSIGSRMARTTLNRFEAQPGLVPDWIYDATYDTSVPTNPRWIWNEPTIAGLATAIAPVGRVNLNAALPKGPDDLAFRDSALNYFRHIVGQRLRVQRRDNPDQLFVVTEFPYRGVAHVYVEDQVNGVRITGYTSAADPGGQLDFSDATLASTGAPFTPILGTDTTYYVTYRWMEQVNTPTGPRMQGVIDEALTLTNVTATVTVDRVFQAQDRAPTAQIIGGTVPVRFRRRVDNAATGIPRLGVVLITSGAQAGDIVSLDYDVDDWRWMVQDDTPNRLPTVGVAPTPTPIPSARSVSIPLRNVDDSQPLYGMLTGTLAGGQQVSLATAEWDWGTNQQATTPPPQPTGAQVLLRVAPRSGTVTYDVNTINVSSPQHVAPKTRTVYRTLDGWAHQLSVGARSYIPFYPSRPAAQRERWREYVWDRASYLYFPPSEAGKSIIVTYQVGSASSPPNSGIFTIEEDTIPESTGLGFAANGRVARVELTGPGGTVMTPAAILGVRGVSVRARSAWIDNGRYQQTAVADYRPLNPS